MIGHFRQDPFDFTGQSAGVVGGRLYANFKVSDALTFGASAAYLTEEDDHIIDVDALSACRWYDLSVLENTSFQLQLQYKTWTSNTLVLLQTMITMRSAPVPASSSISKIL